MKTSRFFCLRLFTMSLTSAWPRGSRPVVGSSKRTMSGSVRSAVATLILCFMPLENLPTFLSIHSSIFTSATRSEEHTSELQSLAYLVCRLLLEKKKKTKRTTTVEDYSYHICDV